MDCSMPGLPVHHQLPELLKLMSIESVMPSNHLILCHPLLLLPSILSGIRVFSNESVFCIRWPKYWSFSFSISPSNEYSGLISFRMDCLSPWISLQSKGLSRVFYSTTVQKHQFFNTQLSLWSNSHIYTWLHKRKLYTWTSPDGQCKKQIDYILCSQRLRNSIQSAKTRELSVAQIMNSLLPNSDLNWRK